MNKIDKKVTIKDVAKHAGVGIGTVSRAINQSDGISLKTKEIILKSIKELGYTPNQVAQSMRSNRYRNIVLFADISHSAFSQIAKGIQAELRNSGYTLSLCDIGENDVTGKILSFIEGRQFDGIILSLPREGDIELNKALSKISIPIVTLDRDIPSLPAGILTDYYSSVKKATNYLLNLGHRGIALVGGHREIRPTRVGKRAYLEAYEENDLSPEEKWIRNGKFTSDSGREILNDLLEDIHERRVTAILSLNNQMFHGILQGMRQNGLKYPEDVSLITFEDNELTQLLNPAVTVIRRPLLDMGSSIAKVLVRYIEEPDLYGKIPPIAIPTEFILRDSCKPVFFKNTVGNVSR